MSTFFRCMCFYSVGYRLNMSWCCTTATTYIVCTCIYDMGKRPTVIGELERYVEANFSRSIYFKTRLAGRGERLNTIYVTQEELEEKIHMDITYEDE